MRIVALITAHDEQRFIGPCIEHLRAQGVEVHVTDNGSTDATVDIARGYLGDGVIAVEHLPRGRWKDLDAMWGNAERLAAELGADWYMLQGADEFRVSPRMGRTLADELAEADAAGFNAASFVEFTFVPCAEAPDHDHDRFLETMRWYYPFLPHELHNVTAWKARAGPVELRSSGGQHALLRGLRISRRQLWMRHYQWLSVEHAMRKYAKHLEDPAAPRSGNWRDRLLAEHVVLPPCAELRRYVADHFLDPSRPRSTHLLHSSIVSGARDTGRGPAR